jgi:hypothetical protein
MAAKHGGTAKKRPGLLKKKMNGSERNLIKRRKAAK